MILILFIFVTIFLFVIITIIVMVPLTTLIVELLLSVVIIIILMVLPSATQTELMSVAPSNSKQFAQFKSLISTSSNNYNTDGILMLSVFQTSCQAIFNRTILTKIYQSSKSNCTTCAE